MSASVRTRTLPTDEASPELLAAVRRLLDEAFEGEFSEDDWGHTTGGWHVVALDGQRVVAHASVVPRMLEIGGRGWDCGYVEGVATAADRQGQGLGSLVMTELGGRLRSRFEIGALSTSRQRFYERLGWERWQGPTFVREAGGLRRTPEEDDGIMVLRFGPSRAVDLDAAIACEARTGDDW